MKAKRAMSLALATIMTISEINSAFAGEQVYDTNIIISDEVISDSAVTTEIDSNGIYMENLTPTNSDRYTGNEGDSFIDKIGRRNGNIDVNGNTWEHGLTAWVARWNFTSESSWVWNTYDLNKSYNKLTGNIVLIDSYNEDNFKTQIVITGDGKEIYTEVLTPSTLPIMNLDLDVSGVSELKIYLYDIESVAGGTAFGLADFCLWGNDNVLGAYELNIFEQMARMYWTPYLRFLLISENFNHVLYMAENDTTMHAYVDILGKELFGGTDGIRDLLSASTSVKDAESILIGCLEECDNEVTAMAEAKATNKVCSILNKSLEKYIVGSSLKSEDIDSIKSILGDQKFYDTFDKEGYNGLIKYVQDTLGAADDSDVMKTLNDFAESDQLQNALSDGLDVLDIGLKLIDLTKTSIDNYTDYFVLQEADAIYLEILEYIENNAIFDVVKDAAHNVRIRANQNLDDATYDIYLELINEGSVVIAEELWDELLEKVWFLNAVKEGKDLGVNFSNLFFHTEESLKLKDSMRNLTYIGMAVSKYVRSNLDAYLADLQNNNGTKTTYYCERIIYASEMLYKIRSLGEECFENFCKANYITKWNEAIKSRKSILEIVYRDLFEENGKITKIKSLLISCPVTIEVYDSNNEKILTVYDGVETTGSVNNISYEVSYNEATDDYMKILNIPEDLECYIKIVGNDIGSVDCLVSSINNETGVIEYKGTYNVPVKNGSVLTSSSITDMDNLKLISEDNLISSGSVEFSDAFSTGYVGLTGISLEYDGSELPVGEKRQIKFKYTPSNATNPTVTWKSSDNNIIKVNSDGVIEGISEGEATISITSFDEKYSDSINVVVRKDNVDTTESTTVTTEPTTETTTILTNEDIVPYDMGNGKLYFNKSSNTIVSADKELNVVDIPSSIENVEVKAIGDNAFSTCINLTNITIPQSIASISKNAFEGCPALTVHCYRGSCADDATLYPEGSIITYIDETSEKGDINGDGLIDSRDSLILFKHIAGDAVDIDESLVDFNNDNTVDSRDSLILFRYVAGDYVSVS